MLRTQAELSRRHHAGARELLLKIMANLKIIPNRTFDVLFLCIVGCCIRNGRSCRAIVLSHEQYADCACASPFH